MKRNNSRNKSLL